MKIAIVPNPAKSEAMACTREILSVLEGLGCQTVLKTDLFDGKASSEVSGDELSFCDMFIAVGGDGTIIHAAKLAVAFDKPILGVNAGTLGFTAGVERNELSLLSRLLEGGYREEKRLMVAVDVISGGRRIEFLALNDAVVSGESARIMNYRMALDENMGYDCRADGFIVATPTGSTAYSLSAGGPIIQPDMKCLVYTPICPHSLFNRSVVFGGDTRLVVAIPRNGHRLFLTVDGESPLELREGDQLVFSRSEKSARFVRLGKKDFYDVLNQKIIQTR